jgi:hypothetical protein
MRSFVLNAAGALAAIGFMALPLGASTASARDWDDQYMQRCDSDGDRCATFRCDRDGDDCVRVTGWSDSSYRSDYDRSSYPSYYKSGYRYPGYTTRMRCDADGDNCVRERCDSDGDNCRTIFSY